MTGLLFSEITICAQEKDEANRRFHARDSEKVTEDGGGPWWGRRTVHVEYKADGIWPGVCLGSQALLEGSILRQLTPS